MAPLSNRMNFSIYTILIMLIWYLVGYWGNILASDEVHGDPHPILNEGSLSDSRLTEGFKELIYLEAYPHHSFDTDSMDVRVGFWRLSETDSALAVHVDSILVEQEKIGDIEQRIYSLRLDVFSSPPSERLVFTSQMPFRVSPMSFTIPTDGLEGVYLVRPRIIDPSGMAHHIWYLPEVDGEKPYSPTIFLGIHRGRDYVMESVTDSTTPEFTRLKVVGSPGRNRYPRDDKQHSYARSVWDLHYYENRIYVGAGDWDNNQGPVDIWSFSAENSKSRYQFQREITVDEESVDRFRTCAERLVVPGIDATESWKYGNMYIKERGQWYKRRTLPDSHHVFDAAYFAHRLFASTATKLGAALYESSDWGKTWVRYSHDNVDELSDGAYLETAVISDGLIVTPGQEYLYNFQDGNLERLVIPLFPGLEKDHRKPHRLIPFLDGLLYTDLRWKEDTTPKPLFFLRDLRKGAVIIEKFQEDRIHDIVVRDDVCYVLACRRVEKNYIGSIYESRDLKEWSLVAGFEVGALAYSLEIMDGVFYVGLAALVGQACPQSGNICRLDP